MRTVYWLFVVSVGLFVAGIAFVVAGGRAAQRAAPAEVAVSMTPVASVRQIMNGIVAPAATVVYQSVGSTVSAAGIVDRAPRNDEEWAHVANSAAALAESGNLLAMEGRAVDDGWIAISRRLTDAAAMALKAAEAKSTDGILDAGGTINETCDDCHAKYQRQ